MKSNLSQIQMQKVLKTLEMRKLIKAVKSVASKNRKVYMLYELEPSKELTGGAWYTEQEFDAEFIEVLRDHCLKFILHKVCLWDRGLKGEPLERHRTLPMQHGCQCSMRPHTSSVHQAAHVSVE
jgi:hypothetical protein